MIFATYIWLDAENNTRSKLKIINNTQMALDLSDFPEWNYDGSSTGQADGHYSEINLIPVAYRKDLISNYGGNSYFVLRETYLPDNTPHSTNIRSQVTSVFEKYNHEKPMFGIEQEFFFTRNGVINFFNTNPNPEKQGNYYCSVGQYTIIQEERKCIEEIVNIACQMGIPITGMNAEVAPSQWEIQLCATGIQA